MAVKSLVILCDWCEQETREHEEELDAAAAGWWIIYGPPKRKHVETDAICELAFCKADCREAYFEYYADAHATA